MTRSSQQLSLKTIDFLLPYSGKLSREKTFTFFVVSEPSAKVFSAKFCEIRNVHVACMCVAHARGPHLHNNWTGATRESFLREIVALYRNAKVFSLESFPLYGIMCINISHTHFKVMLVLHKVQINTATVK